MVRDLYPSARLLVSPTNLGFCAGNNLGIAQARGRFVALLNNDAEAQPGWLAAMLRAAESDPKCGMVASKILNHADPTRIDKAGHLIFLDGQNRGRGTGERDEGQYDQPEEALWPDGCAALYRKEMLDQIGGLDEDFFAYADDAELGLRARRAGWACLYAPEAIVLHHRGQTLGQQSLVRVRLIERNRVLLVAKLFPWSLIWLNGVLYLLRLTAGLLAGLRGKGEAAKFPGLRPKLLLAWTLLKADLEALTLIPRMLGKRRLFFRNHNRLSHRQTLRLLWRFRIKLRDLSEQSL